MYIISETEVTKIPDYSQPNPVLKYHPQPAPSTYFYNFFFLPKHAF
jgi:hypothetical protein